MRHPSLVFVRLTRVLRNFTSMSHVLLDTRKYFNMAGSPNGEDRRETNNSKRFIIGCILVGMCPGQGNSQSAAETPAGTQSNKASGGTSGESVRTACKIEI
jgi:hypothetical protein